jgi:hypothetical protein
MINKKFWSGMLIMALVFGTAVIGCDNGTTGNATPGGSVGGPADITFTVEANGKADKENSTQLYFTFSEAVSDLKVEKIFISAGTGTAEINVRAPGGVWTGSGQNWTLNITTFREGKIRVSIEKEGIERGRKTVTVYKDNASGKTSGEAITLFNTQWEKGYLLNEEAERWYKFEAEEGLEYIVKWQDKTGKVGINEWCYVNVTAYKSDATTTTGEFQTTGYYTTGLFISGETGVVYLKVVTKGSGGNFEIRFVDTTNMGPKDDISMLTASATLNFSVVVSWQVRSMISDNPIESSGYKVYRSETENGTYKEIADVPGPSTPKEFDFQNYTDTGDTDEGLAPNKTYWYRVSGYNINGEGEMSEPIESTLVQDVEAGTTLLTLGEETEGELRSGSQVDMYKFTAEAGRNYEVIWEAYPMVIQISAYHSDKTLVNGYYGGIGETLSGVSGTVYLEVTVNSYFFDMFGALGPYTIKVVEQ